MTPISELLHEYGKSHKNRTNIAIHSVAVPVIYFVSVALIWSIPPGLLSHIGVTWAHVVVLPVLWYYFKLSGAVGAAMTFLTCLSFIAIEVLVFADISVWKTALSLFVVMWVLQFVGHKIEGKKPSFFQDLQFLLVGPAWWWTHWFRRWDIDL